MGVKFNYIYREGETPEERLRNVLSPMFALVDMTDMGMEINEELIQTCKESKESIRALLNDIPLFYDIKVENISFTQDDTLNSN